MHSRLVEAFCYPSTQKLFTREIYEFYRHSKELTFLHRLSIALCSMILTTVIWLIFFFNFPPARENFPPTFPVDQTILIIVNCRIYFDFFPFHPLWSPPYFHPHWNTVKLSKLKIPKIHPPSQDHSQCSTKNNIRKNQRESGPAFIFNQVKF